MGYNKTQNIILGRQLSVYRKLLSVGKKKIEEYKDVFKFNEIVVNADDKFTLFGLDFQVLLEIDKVNFELGHVVTNYVSIDSQTGRQKVEEATSFKFDALGNNHDHLNEEAYNVQLNLVLKFIKDKIILSTLPLR
jgi:hypothetical protein